MENPTQLYNINKTLTDVSGLPVTTNEFGTVGINVYQIYPKQLIYLLSPFSSASTGTFIGANNTTAFTVSAFNIGKIHPRNFNIYNTSASNANNISVIVDYVNSSGDRAVNTITVNNSASAIRLSNAININRITFNTSQPFYTGQIPSDAVIVARDTSHNVERNLLHGNFNCCDAVITVPNGYIGTLTDLYIYVTANDNINMYVKDSRNNIKEHRKMIGVPIVVNHSMYYGNYNYPLYPGDSIFFSSELTATGNKSVRASVKLTAY
jgi:hypothetical protein